MSPDELKALRKELGCTAKELANALELEQSTVLALGERRSLPDQAVHRPDGRLRKRGPGAIPRKAKGGDPMKVLGDPILWELVRKLATHKKLRDEVVKLASRYPDPIED